MSTFSLLTVYRPKNESSEADLFSSSAEMLADWGFACPANKFSREWTLQGSKVTRDSKRQDTFIATLLFPLSHLNRVFRHEPYSVRSGNFV